MPPLQGNVLGANVAGRQPLTPPTQSPQQIAARQQALRNVPQVPIPSPSPSDRLHAPQLDTTGMTPAPPLMPPPIQPAPIQFAQGLAKRSADVEIHGRKSPPVHSFLDRLVYDKEELAPPTQADHENWQGIADYMTASQPGQLNTARVFSGRVDPASLISQVQRHRDHDVMTEDVGGIRDQVAQAYAGMTPTGVEQMPSSYHPYANSVVANERSPGLLIHELGHGVDLGRAQGQSNLRRWLRWKLKPQLWQEHSAWRKGRKAYQAGFAASPEVDDPAARAQYHKNMESYHGRKYPAFGTYLGGALGGLGGAVGGGALGLLAASQMKANPSTTNNLAQFGLLAGAGLGGSAGILGGAGAGKLWSKLRRNANRRKDETRLEDARNSPDAAAIRQRLLELRAQRAKQPPKRDADHDGKINDGTKDEEPVSKAAAWACQLAKRAEDAPDFVPVGSAYAFDQRQKLKAYPELVPADYRDLSGYYRESSIPETPHDFREEWWTDPENRANFRTFKDKQRAIYNRHVHTPKKTLSQLGGAADVGNRRLTGSGGGTGPDIAGRALGLGAMGAGVGGSLGLGLGSALAPAGHRLEGAGRGLAIGGATGLGGGAGAALGGLYANRLLGTDARSKLLGNLVGLGLGGAGGYGLSRALLGKPSWKEEEKAAGVFWKDLKEPVPILMGELDNPEKSPQYALAERKQDPRWLTRLFAGPGTDYQNQYYASYANKPLVSHRDRHLDVTRRLLSQYPQRYGAITPPTVMQGLMFPEHADRVTQYGDYQGPDKPTKPAKPRDADGDGVLAEGTAAEINEQDLTTRTPIKNKAMETVLRNQFGFRQNTPLYREHDFFKHLGGDDLDEIESIMELEDALGVALNEKRRNWRKTWSTLGSIEDHLGKLTPQQKAASWARHLAVAVR